MQGRGGQGSPKQRGPSRWDGGVQNVPHLCAQMHQPAAPSTHHPLDPLWIHSADGETKAWMFSHQRGGTEGTLEWNTPSPTLPGHLPTHPAPVLHSSTQGLLPDWLLCMEPDYSHAHGHDTGTAVLATGPTPTPVKDPLCRKGWGSSWAPSASPAPERQGGWRGGKWKRALLPARVLPTAPHRPPQAPSRPLPPPARLEEQHS